MYTENSLFVCSVNEPGFLWYVWNYNCYKQLLKGIKGADGYYYII